MGYHPMTEQEVHDFLTAEPARPAILATTRKDGRPHAAPIWYFADADGSLLFNTAAGTVKGRNLARTGQAVITVQDDRAPYAFVMLEGEVTLDDDLTRVRHWATVIGGRYMGADRAQEYGARNGVEGELLVRFTPTKVVSAADVAD